MNMDDNCVMVSVGGIPIKAMLDSGSRRYCIRENVVRRLRLPVQKN